MKNIIMIRNLYKSFYGALALSGMNFTVNEGEIRCLIGENGCGKSTMIKVISGFYDFDSGELIINGKNYKKISPAESIAEGIQVIYQDFSLFPNMTIAENIMMYSTVSKKKARVNWKVVHQGAVDTLNKIHFNIDPDIYVADLNVAQKQMVAICRAIVQNARLLIMDEPTTALTTKEVEQLFSVVRKLKKEGVAVLFVSHKLDEVVEICDSYTVMRNGRDVFCSNSGDPLPKTEKMVLYMTGKNFDSHTFEYSGEKSAPILQLENLTMKSAFHKISFALYRGEILGITGLLGCGRNELAEALFGLKPVSDGKILVAGKDVGHFKSVSDALKCKIAYVPEDRLTEGLHLSQSIADNVITRIVRNYASHLGILNIRSLREKQTESLRIMPIAGMIPENAVDSLSGGNQQKIVLIKWLISDPDILILNCPTVGVDVGAKSDIHGIMRKLAKEKGVGIIIISNDIYEIMQTCNRVLVMKNGEITQEVQIKDTTMNALEELIAAS